MFISIDAARWSRMLTQSNAKKVDLLVSVNALKHS